MKRNGAIDLMRFLFAALIVVFHSRNFLSSDGRVFTSGRIGVEFFFILSGYLMAHSASRRQDIASIGSETVRFIADKIKRLLPNVYVAWVIAMGVIIASESHPVQEWLRKLSLASFELMFLGHAGLTGYRANSATWYLSAMLIAMALLYPILLKYRSTFLTYIAPLIAIFLLGYMYQNWDIPFAGPSRWLGFTTRGLVRAVAEVSLGATCWAIGQRLSKIKPTKLLSGIFTLTGVGGLVIILVYAWDGASAQVDFVMLMLLAYVITIAFSGKGLLAGKLNHPVFGWLGAFSLNLFLGHGFWSNALNALFPTWSDASLMTLYLVLSSITALVIMYASIGLKAFWAKYSHKIKPWFFQSEQTSS